MTRKPHLYFWDGRWWVSRNGPIRYQNRRELDAIARITLNDAEAGTFSRACKIARHVNG